jgi:transposase
VLARRRYLRQKRANRNPDGSLKRPEVYLDETFVNKNHSGQFTWYLEEDGPWVNKPSGKGPRLIIVHAMTGLGWVPGAELIFEAAKRTGDYHGQMNWENFSRWFSDQLLPNIPSHSLIILDNAPYHNVVVEDAFPTPKSRKEQLSAWLTKNGIPWTPDMLKPELYDLYKKCAPAPAYRLDQLAEASGHRLLRTPQYHPELQPIETCWGIVKNYMADQCDFTTQNFHKQLPIALSKVKPSTCRKLIAKVVEQEEKYWAEDEQLYEHDFDEISDGEECATDQKSYQVM